MEVVHLRRTLNSPGSQVPLCFIMPRTSDMGNKQGTIASGRAHVQASRKRCLIQENARKVALLTQKQRSKCNSHVSDYRDRRRQGCVILHRCLNCGVSRLLETMYGQCRTHGKCPDQLASFQLHRKTKSNTGGPQRVQAPKTPEVFFLQPGCQLCCSGLCSAGLHLLESQTVGLGFGI